MQAIEMNEPTIDIHSKIVKSKYYVKLNNTNHKIHIPNPDNIENTITTVGYIIKIDPGAYEPDGWVQSIQVLSCDIKNIEDI